MSGVQRSAPSSCSLVKYVQSCCKLEMMLHSLSEVKMLVDRVQPGNALRCARARLPDAATDFVVMLQFCCVLAHWQFQLPDHTLGLQKC